MQNHHRAQMVQYQLNYSIGGSRCQAPCDVGDVGYGAESWVSDKGWGEGKGPNWGISRMEVRPSQERRAPGKGRRAYFHYEHMAHDRYRAAGAPIRQRHSGKRKKIVQRGLRYL